jgi:GTP-binding protein
VKSDVEAEDSIRVAVVGRPNVGKSSLVNCLLGKDRMVVDDVPGTTRDAIDSEIVHAGQRYTLVDTAGLRRKIKVKDATEYFSGVRTRQSIERAEVVLILLEANVPISAQDVRIAAEVSELNRGAVLVLNKWDLVEGKETNTARDMEHEIRERLPFMDYAPAIFISALTAKRVTGLFPLIKAVHTQATRRFTTGELNRFFERLQKRNPAPASPSGLAPRIYYAVQTDVLPPTFNVYVNHPKAVAPNYVRFLEHRMRDELKLEGTPVAFHFRKSE